MYDTDISEGPVISDVPDISDGRHISDCLEIPEGLVILGLCKLPCLLNSNMDLSELFNVQIISINYYCIS